MSERINRFYKSRVFSGRKLRPSRSAKAGEVGLSFNDELRRNFIGSASALALGLPGLQLFAAAALSVFPAAVTAAREGVDFRVLQSRAPQESSDRIDVLGFFWFGCPHCFTLEPALKAWASKLPGDVAFRKVHVPWRDQMQQLYYSLEALNKLALIDKVFEAIHKDKINLQNAQQMADWIARHGVDAKSFQDAFDSFGVRTRMKRAAQLAEAYRLEGVPAIGVAGKYLTSPSMAGSNQQALAVVDELLATERRSRPGAKS